MVGLGNPGAENEEIMKLVVGLGNPGPAYERTRHNVGFRVVDKLAEKLGWKWTERRARALLASGTLGSEKVILVKPLTFMNLSGEAVGELVRWYKAQSEDVLVVYDELDLPVGKIRLRPRGSAAGHNGLDDIIAHLHTNAFPRLRIGIGHPKHSRMSGKDHVLGVPPLDEHVLLERAEDRAVEAIEMWISQGITATMNAVNADPEAEQKAEEKRQRQKERQEQARLRREALQREQAAQGGQQEPGDLVARPESSLSEGSVGQ